MKEKIRQILFSLGSRGFLVVVMVVVLLLLLALPLTFVAVQNHAILMAQNLTSVTIRKPTQTGQNTTGSPIQRYLYVLPEGGIMYVYDIDHNHVLAKEITLPPGVRFIRGVGADPASHALYIAYGSVSGGGQLMKMDLLTDQVIGSSLKKVSLLAYGREEDQKENEEEGREKIKEAEKRELMRDGGREDAISQNWRDRTSAFFAVLSS